MTLRTALLAGLLTTAALPAWADTRIEYQVEGTDGVVDLVLIGHGMMRMNQRGSGYWNLYDLDSDTFYQVNDARKEYRKIDHARMRRFREQAEEANRYVDRMWPVVLEQMRTIDRKYPQLMERARTMDQDMPAAVAALKRAGAKDLPTDAEMEEVYAAYKEWSKYKSWEEAIIVESKKQYAWSLQNTTRFSVRKAGKRNVAGRSCEVTEISLSTEALPRPVKLTEYCGVAPAALGLPPEDQAVVEGLRRTTAAFTGQANEIELVPSAVARHLGIKSKVEIGLNQITLDALPIQTRYYTGNAVSTTSTLASVSTTETIDPAQFRLPKGYRQYDHDADHKLVMDAVARMEAANQALQASGVAGTSGE